MGDVEEEEAAVHVECFDITGLLLSSYNLSGSVSQM